MSIGCEVVGVPNCIAATAASSYTEQCGAILAPVRAARHRSVVSYLPGEPFARSMCVYTIHVHTHTHLVCIHTHTFTHNIGLSIFTLCVVIPVPLICSIDFQWDCLNVYTIYFCVCVTF